MTPAPRPTAPAPGLLVVLNGTSSAGKSTLARALQARLPGDYLHVALDAFRAMEPAGYFGPGARPQHGLRLAALCRALHGTCATYLAHGQNVLLDHVLDPAAWRHLADDLAGHRVLLVAVHCDADELARRERQRPDRAPGLAASQRVAIHHQRRYDFSVDTTSCSADDCAAAVATWLATGPQPAAFAPPPGGQGGPAPLADRR